MSALRLPVAVSLVLLSSTAAAADAGPDFAALALRTVFSLLLVIAIALAAAYLLRRMQGRSLGVGQRLRLLESVSVGMKEKVVLMAVGDRQLLLGVAPGNVRLLHVLDQPLPSPEAAPAEVGFSALLQRMRQRG